MIARADVWILRDEAAIGDDGREVDLQPPAGGHALARVAGDVDEHALDPFGLDVDVECGRALRENQLDVVAGDALEHRFHVAQHAVHADRFEGVHLPFAVDAQLTQETRRACHFTEQLLALMTEDRVAVDGRQPLLAILGDVTEQVVAGDGDLRGEPPDGFHPLRLPQLVFDRAKLGDVFRDDLDRVAADGDGLQPDHEAPAIFPSPRGFEELGRSRVDRAFDQPAQIVGRLEDRGREVDFSQLIGCAIAEQSDERAVRVRDRAVAAASPHAERRALELTAMVVLALIELRLQERHAVGVDLQEVALAGGRFERLTQGVELSVKKRDVVTAGFLRRAELLFALAQGAGGGFLGGAMAGGLRGELRLAFGDDDVESRPFGSRAGSTRSRAPGTRC